MANKIEQYNILLLGADGVGKSSMLYGFVHSHIWVETYDPCEEYDYRKQVMVDGKPSIIEVLDGAGDIEYVALREHWIKCCDGVLLVYCINSRASFDKIQKYHHEICAIKGVGNTHICLVGNKSDLDTEREVSTQEGDSLAQSLGCEFMETSAMNIPDLEKAFFNVVRQVQRFRRNTVVVHKVGAVGEQVDLPGGGQSTHRRNSSLSFFTKFFQRSKGPKK